MATIEDTYEEVIGFAWRGATDEGRKFIEATGPQSHRRGSATVRWVGELHDVVHHLTEEMQRPAWPYVGMFWVRLHDVVRELSKSYALARVAAKEPGRRRAVVYKAAAVADAADEIAKLLSEDELIAVDFLRQVNGHLFQSKYEVRWNHKTQSADDARGFQHLNTKIPVDEALRRVTRVITDLGGELGCAVELSKRLATQIDALMATVDALYSTGVDEWDT